MSQSKFREQNIAIANILAAPTPHSSDIDPDYMPEPILQCLVPNGKMTPSACSKIMNFTTKEKKVKSVCDLSRVKVRPDDGRIYILINRKTISSADYPGLIEKLYDHYFGTLNVTLAEYFEIWMKWREEETNVTPKTIKENRFLWNALIKESSLASKKLKDITVQNYISFFRRITKGRTLTRKRFNDMKSILNGMLYLAVEQGIIGYNCLNSINYKQFDFKPVNTQITPYTEKDRLRIIEHLSNETDFYSLAILFDFHMVLRIGELKGLKWSDIDGNSIRIQRFVDDKNRVIDSIKGNTADGIRSMPLTPATKAILNQVRKLQPDDQEFIFYRGDSPLATVTFNRRLKKCCNELGIEYRSSHKLRFSTASIMYKNGMEDTELQKLLGHTTLSMTRHYLCNITSDEETANKMAAILG